MTTTTVEVIFLLLYYYTDKNIGNMNYICPIMIVTFTFHALNVTTIMGQKL